MNEVSILNILNAAREGTAIIDPEYKIVFANQSFCKDAQCRVDYLIGRSCHEIIRQKRRPCFETGANCSVKQTFETGRAGDFSRLHFDQYRDSSYEDGILCPLQPSFSDSNFVFVVRSKIIIPKNYFETQLSNTPKTGGVKNRHERLVHDFYNILSPLFTYSEMLDEELPTESPLRQYVEGILKSVEKTKEFGKEINLFYNQLQKETKPVEPEMGANAKNRELILFVDDDDLVAAAGKRLIERIGYQVDMYTCAFEALKAFKEQPNAYHLVITDYEMPKMPGDQLSRELLKIRADIPVIICTGLNQMTTEKLKAIGISCIINKPISSIELSEKIKIALGRDNLSGMNLKRQIECGF